jgi:DNA-directed RNA polymerase specialized sigma24 family protein
VAERLKQRHQLASQDNLNMRLKKTGLPAKALVDANTERAIIDAALRVETIHGVKGEGLDAVLYLADKEHAKALVNAERILADSPPKVREARMMRYGSSESWSDVAARTATSPGAIRKKCKRCLDRIRQKLGILGGPQ